MKVSIGVCAYNEEKNIKKLLTSLINQKTNKIKIDEIFVVSSACTDNTNNIVREFEKKDKRVKLIDQKEREGKSSAINLFLKNAKNEILVLESGDTVPEENTIERLCIPFEKEEVGMTGSRPIPVNRDNNFMGFVVNFFWKLHHEIAMENPKCGELVAFRDFVKEIPKESAVDEASIEAIVREKGYKLEYVPNAVVRNKGPETVKDFLIQRRRINAGHVWLEKVQKHTVSTDDLGKVIKLVARNFSLNPKKNLWIVMAMAIEAYGKFLGRYDYYIKNKNPYIWNIAKSTKELKNA
ncbi:glycosyltransferase [Candidatus Woesearchaeota archaeon]|nr:glycosyltransferase [Candidatus Woesearchaeota archaeon]